MFNRLDMCEMLISRGAKKSAKNPDGETALDLAPPTLAKKLESL